jgi:endonuclease/exonuclease/phosphatase family metal-dependent hydrolase
MLKENIADAEPVTLGSYGVKAKLKREIPLAADDARVVEALQVTEVMGSARTFPALVPWLRMDRIYQRGFALQGARVLRGPSWARLSDHAPLVADFTLRR